MDFPRHVTTPTHICSLSRWIGGLGMHAVGSPGVPTSLTWTANVAVYIPMWLPFHFNARRAFWIHGSVVSGTFDIGVYTNTGSLLWSAGATTNAGTALTLQYVTITPDLLLTPGAYYIAYANSGTTNQVSGAGTQSNTGRMSGMMQQASAMPLPATATFAQYASAHNPYIGLTSTESGF